MVFKTLLILVLVGCLPWVGHAQFRDPTQPAYPLPTKVDSSAERHVEAELILSAIGISSKTRWAIINGVLAKQGETVTITAKPDSSHIESANNTMQNLAMSLTGHSKQHLPSTHQDVNGNVDMSTRSEMTGPLAGIISPLVAGAIKSLDIPQLQQQNKDAAASGFEQEAKRDPLLSLHSMSIKIMSIGKNSVTIDQNGELKTLKLIQRSYKTTHKPHLLK